MTKWKSPENIVFFREATDSELIAIARICLPSDLEDINLSIHRDDDQVAIRVSDCFGDEARVAMQAIAGKLDCPTTIFSNGNFYAVWIG